MKNTYVLYYNYIHSLERNRSTPVKEIMQQPLSVLWHPGNECYFLPEGEENLFSIPLLLEIACNSLHLKGFLYTSAHCLEAVLHCIGSSPLCI